MYGAPRKLRVRCSKSTHHRHCSSCWQEVCVAPAKPNRLVNAGGDQLTLPAASLRAFRGCQIWQPACMGERAFLLILDYLVFDKSGVSNGGPQDLCWYAL